MDLSRAWSFSNEVELVSDIHQLPAFDLRMAFGHPLLKPGRVQFGMALQGLV